MIRRPGCAMGVALVSLLLLLGCQRAQENRQGEAPPPPAEPVLQAGDDARVIVEKAARVLGGEKAVSRWNCGYVKYDTRGGIFPAEIPEATVEDTFQLPGHFKRVARVRAGGRELSMVSVVNHGKGWVKHGNAEARAIDNKVTEETEHQFAHFCGVAGAMRPDVRLTKLGVDKVRGRTVLGVRAESDEEGQLDLYFDQQTGLLATVKKPVPGGAGVQRGFMETHLDDYKDIHGAMVPMRIRGVQNGKALLDVTLLEVRFADRFPEGTFSKP
ncbi:MAG: hypothetical protein L0Z62_41920 [Gemmataceae bacterium]|nr:hypothetical protein [Gemmataceae bacterium]